MMGLGSGGRGIEEELGIADNSMREIQRNRAWFGK
jgi:hypothetical protein